MPVLMTILSGGCSRPAWGSLSAVRRATPCRAIRGATRSGQLLMVLWTALQGERFGAHRRHSLLSVATAAICRRSVRCGFTIHRLPARHHAPSRPHHALISSQSKLMHLSLQVRCAMGGTFCATGTMGLTADLTAGEIVEQLVHARRVAQIRNIVFMVGAAAVGVQDYCSTLLAVRPLALEAGGQMHNIECIAEPVVGRRAATALTGDGANLLGDSRHRRPRCWPRHAAVTIT